MSSIAIQAVVDGAAVAIAAAAITSHGRELKIYDHEARDLDTLPALTIDGPTTFRRTQPDEAESQLGAYDWFLTFTLRIYVALDDPQTATHDARAILGQVMAALDADRGLGGAALIDASLSSGELTFTEEENRRPMAVYECALEVWTLVS